MTSDTIIAKVIFSIVVVPIAVVFIIIAEIIIKPITYTCVYSGCFQSKTRQTCTILAFLIASPIFFVILLLATIFFLPYTVFQNLKGFYSKDDMNESVKFLFLGNFSQMYIEEKLNLKRKTQNDFWEGFSNCCVNEA